MTRDRTASDALELAAELIRIDTTPTGDLEPAFLMLADRLDAAGFEVAVHELDGKPNLVASLGAAELAGTCLTGHLDTVPVVESDWTTDPWGGDVGDGVLTGRGSADMKAGIAAMVVAAETIARDRPDAALRLIVTSEEEVGALGAAALAASVELPRVSALIVGEPTDLAPRFGHRGALWLDLESQGVAAHGSTPHLGSSAIETMTEDLAWLSELVVRDAADDEHLGPDTINVGVVRGGSQRNVVPAHAVAEVDIRVGPSRFDTLTEILESTAPPAGSALTLVRRLPPVITDRAEPLIVAAERISGTRAVPALYFTDASVLTGALGEVPTVILGPGSPSKAHVADEDCPAEQVVRAADWYQGLLVALAGG